MGDDKLKALTPAQRRTAARYPWYRAWLLRSGRTAEEIDGKARSPAVAKDGKR